MPTINQILTEDKRHDLMKCPKVRGRRLYIRDSKFKLNLGYPDLELDIKPIPKQRFRPIGIICITCGFIMSGSRLMYTKKDINAVSFAVKDATGDNIKLSRAERRALSRNEEKRRKSFQKLGINE